MIAAHRTPAEMLAFFRSVERSASASRPPYDFAHPAERRPSALRAPRLGHERRAVGRRRGGAGELGWSGPVTLTVLSVAYPLAPVGSDAGGGAEQVLTHSIAALVAGRPPLARGRLRGLLARAAHRRARAKAGPSIEAARQRAWARTGRRSRRARPLAGRPRALARHRFQRLSAGARRAGPGDAASAAVLVSAGGASGDAARHLAQLRLRGTARGLPSTPNLLAPIENGVAVERLRRGTPSAASPSSLGRICPEKGVHLAIEAAKKADVTLLIAGEVFPTRRTSAISPRRSRRASIAGAASSGRSASPASGAS